GRSEDELAELGERLFVQGISGSLYPEGWRLVEAHQQAGHIVVLASSATRFQVEPAARAMGISHILVSPVEIVNGLVTGRAGGRRCATPPGNTASTCRRATPTLTATKTCRSCRPSDGRVPSTRAVTWPRRRGTMAGRWPGSARAARG